MSLLRVHNLNVDFPAAGGWAAAVREVGFEIGAGEALGLVGESGSGKSVTALSIMRLLLPQARARGEILFDGHELLSLPEEKMRAVRGGGISMIFQEPMTALNPVMRVGDQVAEAIHAGFLRQEMARRWQQGREASEAKAAEQQRRWAQMSKEELEAESLRIGEELKGRRSWWDRSASWTGLTLYSADDPYRQLAVEALNEVAIPDPERRARDYPHQLSGGQRQRVMIAMAIVNRPKLLIADEPTTALDVTVQQQVLDLLRALRAKFRLAMLFISHDLGVISQLCDRVAVMYQGAIVEMGTMRDLFAAPAHPYTQGLLAAIPTLRTDRRKPLRTVGELPPLGAQLAPLREIASGHWVRG